MKLKKLVSDSVEENLKEVALWYNSKQKNLGKVFLKEVNVTVGYICQNPLLFQIRYDSIRIAFLDKFPYGIHYEYLAHENQVNIYAVFHTSRSTEVWTKL
jgi:plasmid stabilization system protein ParE